MHQTEAWVLHQGSEQDPTQSGELLLETFSFPNIEPDEVLLQSVCGAWEGNYNHALERRPVDVCKLRGEERIVLGNCGVVRVLKAGSEAQHLKEGTLCLLLGNAVADRYGYMIKAHAYDAPNTVGIMAKELKAHARQVVPIPESPFSMEQWAVFSLRYITAWANWRMAYGTWRLQVPKSLYPSGFPVWAWGGGTSLAALQLAQLEQADCTLISSRRSRLQWARDLGFQAVDRSEFKDLSFDETRFQSDKAYNQRYRQAEKAFLSKVQESTQAEGVAIFLDQIGEVVFRPTLKALARQGVLASAGWKTGMNLRYFRAIECIHRRNLIHTHYASFQECHDAIDFALKHNWMPPEVMLQERYTWENVGQLSKDYAQNKTETFFPLFYGK